MLLFVILLIFIGLSAGLAWFLISHDHGEREPVGALWLAFGLGFVGAIAAGIIEYFVIPSKNLLPGRPLPTILMAALGVGIVEEACKFVPLALYIYKKRFFNEHTDGVIYFALAGLGFGLPENLLYTLQFGSSAGVGRVLLTPFFHAAITATVGYYLAKGKVAGHSLLNVWPVLIVAMLLHGLYDFGLTSGVGIYAAFSVLITLGLSAALFVLYLHAVEHDQDRGMSVVGTNNFCRSCGFPNPEHHLYCTSCGKNA
jgi:RsiW-degrading membrane proteinase PrsW (M82 family)